MTTSKKPASPSASRPIVAIVGRPNVGKSTLFNRLVGRRVAIVEDVAGVTRDRNYADTTWEGKPFTVVDTGGFLPEPEEVLLKRVRDQARLAIEEAHAVVLVVDGLAGLTAADEEIAGMLRKSGKPVFLAVNKIDSSKREAEEYLSDCYRLGLPHVFATSAEHGRGVGELMDALVEELPAFEPVEEDPDHHICRVAVVGRPNVGKSTFINRLLKEERFVASEVPGTTVDPIDAKLTHGGKQYVLTDTAGIRRKSHIAEKVEQYSVMHSLSTIDRANVVILLLDARELAVEQDAKIASIALEKGKAIIVFVNKWDLVEGTAKGSEFRTELAIRMPFVGWAPVIFGSALTGKHVFQALETAGRLVEQMNARVPTPTLNDFLRNIVDSHPAPRAAGGLPVKLFYISQIGERPPMFAISCNRPDGVSEDYKRFITNRMRESFGLEVPIRLIMKKKAGRKFTPPKKKDE